MSAWLFDDPALVARLEAEAASWIDTPFVVGSCAKGRGVDCIQLLAALGEACGRPHPPLPGYHLQETLHDKRSRLCESLDARANLARLGYGDEDKPFDLEATPPRPGDIAVFRVGLAPHHAGVVVCGLRFVHAILNYGVIWSRLDDTTYRKRLTYLYRLRA